jgi:hypothetical protein
MAFMAWTTSRYRERRKVINRVDQSSRSIFQGGSLNVPIDGWTGKFAKDPRVGAFCIGEERVLVSAAFNNFPEVTNV